MRFNTAGLLLTLSGCTFALYQNWDGERFAHELNEQACTWLVDCTDEFYGDVDECMASLDTETSVYADCTYNHDQGLDCLDAIQDLPCDAVVFPTVCEYALVCDF